MTDQARRDAPERVFILRDKRTSELHVALWQFEGSTEYQRSALASPTPAGVDELAHAKHMAKHYRQLLTVTNKAWLRAAQAVLAGDMGDIRNRVELAEQPFEVVTHRSSAASPKPVGAAGEVERLKNRIAELEFELGINAEHNARIAAVSGGRMDALLAATSSEERTFAPNPPAKTGE